MNFRILSSILRFLSSSSTTLPRPCIVDQDVEAPRLFFDQIGELPLFPTVRP